MNYNENDIITFYNLHGHKQETEIRTINRKKDTDGVSPYFVHNTEELIEKIKELSTQPLDLYIGINERKQNGTEGKDVIAWNGIPIDIEGINHTVEEKPLALKLANLYKEELQKNKIKVNIKDSGRGYELGIYFEDPVPITNDEERNKIKGFFQRIKKYFTEQFTVEGAEVDTSTLEIARVHRIAGTQNQVSKTLSTWVEVQGKTPTQLFKKWVESLKEPEPTEQLFNTEIPEHCALCELALQKPFPNGKRHMRLSPNVAKYIESKPKEKQIEMKEKYYTQQWSNGESRIRDLDNWPNHTFNCPALQKYSKEKGLYNETCINCPHRRKLLKELAQAEENQEYVTNYETIDFTMLKPHFGKTAHINNYELADTLFPLNGDNYKTTKKQTIYLVNSLLQPAIRFSVGQFTFDNRIHQLLFTPPGQGKSTIDNGIKMHLRKLISIRDAGYTSHVEQLKGTMEKKEHGRGKEKQTELIKHEGLLDGSDLVTFDESYDLLNETNMLNAESMRTIRKSCDTYFENEITKPQVLFGDDALKFYAKQRTLMTVHPRKFKSNIFIVSGTYRRFIASEIKPKDINIKDSTNGLKLKRQFSEAEIQQVFMKQINGLRKISNITLTEEAVDEAIEWIDATNEFLVYNPNQSLKYLGVILYKPIKHYFFKCIAVHSLSKNETTVTKQTAAEACCDAVEFLCETLETYSRWNDIAAGANPWGTADPKQSLVLDWMLMKGALTKGESTLTISDVKTCIARVYGVHDRQAAALWISMKKSGLVKSMDKPPYKAWLALHPYQNDEKKIFSPEFADAVQNIEEIRQNNTLKNEGGMQPMQCFFKLSTKLQNHDKTYYNNKNKEFETAISLNCIVTNQENFSTASAASGFQEKLDLNVSEKTASAASVGSKVESKKCDFCDKSIDGEVGEFEGFFFHKVGCLEKAMLGVKP